MPVMYRVACRECDGPRTEGDQGPDDDIEGGVLVPGQSLAYLAEDWRIVPLPHRTGTGRLKQLGTSWWSASIRGSSRST